MLIDVTELVFFSSTSADAEEKTVIWPPADFLGDAKRLSGKMCSKLLQEKSFGGGGGEQIITMRNYAQLGLLLLLVIILYISKPKLLPITEVIFVGVRLFLLVIAIAIIVFIVIASSILFPMKQMISNLRICNWVDATLCSNKWKLNTKELHHFLN